MNKIFLILFLGLSSPFFSQDYMVKITEKTCDCVKHLSDTLDQEGLYQQLGLCMIAASDPYKKQIKKDYNIDLDKLDGPEGEKLGKVVGLKMVTVCPNELLAFTKKTEAMKKEKGVAEKNKFTGTVIKIEEGMFASFTLKDEEGKTLKFYWLTVIKSEIELVTKYKTLMSAILKITYTPRELFDAKIGEYRAFNIIETIEQVSQ